MAYDAGFLAAYILLLSRLWLELEALSLMLPFTGPTTRQRVETRCEIFRLELVLLRDRLEGSRFPLTAAERTRVHTITDQLLAELNPEPLALLTVRIKAAQDLLFEEVRRLLLPLDSRIPTAA